MKYIIFAILLFPAMSNPYVLFDFTKTSNLEDWHIVDDVVMGGESDGNLSINDAGQGVFEGDISLENYGDFSSIRYSFDAIDLENRTQVILKLKGDGKDYQFRVKANARDYYSYITTFSTNGAWQEIAIDLKDMYPSFRGRRLNKPNFSANTIESLSILIGNKKEEHFKLVLDKIILE